MISESQLVANVKQRITQQIQSLREHEHVKSIQKKNDFNYRLSYCPSQTKSVYKQKAYAVQLILPSTYPQDPPSLKFLDQIYHLNIGLVSGEVRMSVLEDDWSPFLSLTSLIQSLDKILEQPDEHYALDAEMLDMFQNNRTQYLNKVLEHVSLADVVSCYSAQRIFKTRDDQFSDTPPTNKFTIQRPFSPQKNRKSEALVQDLRQSMELADESQNYSGIVDVDKQMMGRDYPQFVQTQSIEKGKARGANPKIKSKQFHQIKMDTAQSIEAASIGQNHENPRLPIKSKTLNIQNSNPLLSNKSLTLHKINQTISVFIEELNEIQQQINSTKNQGIKTLLREKYDGQLEMLRELMQLSDDAKRKIVKKLKQQVNKM